MCDIREVSIGLPVLKVMHPTKNTPIIIGNIFFIFLPFWRLGPKPIEHFSVRMRRTEKEYKQRLFRN